MKTGSAKKANVDVFAKLEPAISVIGANAGFRFAVQAPDDYPAAGERYAVLPSFDDPRVLLPLDASGPAWGALLAAHAKGAADPLARTAATLLRFASPRFVRSLLLRDIVWVVGEPDLASETPLHRFLARVLSRNDFVTGLRLAPGRPNSKPVVQAVTPDGAILAYGKFGWDELTKRLVLHESAVLKELCPLTPGMPLKLPGVLFSGEWCGLQALVLSPLTIGGAPHRSSEAPVAASVALAGLAGRQIQRLGESEFWHETARDVLRFGPLLGDRGYEALHRARDAIQANWIGVEFPTGWSHGDWIPANVSIRPDGAFSVWDWERGRHGVPLGVDSMQFILAVEMQRPAIDGVLVERVEWYGRGALARHGLDPETWLVLTMLSLIGSVLWYGEALAAGRAPADALKFLNVLEFFTAQAAKYRMPRPA